MNRPRPKARAFRLPHELRNSPQRIQWLKQTVFVRSTTLLRSKTVREQMKPVYGRSIREMKQKASVVSLSELAPKGASIDRLINHIAKRGFKATGQDKVLIEKSANSAIKNLEKAGVQLGMVLDADKNVIHLDEDGRPYVIAAGDRWYVNVFRARVRPEWDSIETQCTIENIDGLEEVLLVRLIPVMSAN